MPGTRDPLNDPRFASLDAAGVVELCGSLAGYGEAGGLSRDLMLQVGTFAEGRFADEPEVLLAVARMYEHGGEPGRALDLLVRAGRAWPDDERLRTLLENALERQGDPRSVDEALRLLQAEQDPPQTPTSPVMERSGVVRTDARRQGAGTLPRSDAAKLRAQEQARAATQPVMRRVRASEHPPVSQTPTSGMPVVPRAPNLPREAARPGGAILGHAGQGAAAARVSVEEAERAASVRTEVAARRTRPSDPLPSDPPPAPEPAPPKTSGLPRVTKIRLMEPGDERRRLDPYELIGELASGGMATVFLGRLAGAGGFQRLVAIKRLHPHLAREEEFVEMFLDEARIAAGIHHPHVVPILEVGMSDAGYYLVMEFIEGDTLAGLVVRSLQRGATLPPRIAARIVLDALAGLHASHQLTDGSGHYLGLVHRDCTPQNILVGIDGSARITDFGVARAASRLALTAPQRVKGKVAYLSPEQAHALELDRRSDLFTMGIVLWEAIAGRPLFQGETEAATLSRLLAGKVPSLRSFVSEIPAALDEVCRRALAHDRNRRFRTAAEMAEALERAVNAEGFGGPASPRELGRFVEALMGAEIAAQREAVRHWLSALDAGASGPVSRGPRPPMRSAPGASGRASIPDDAPETPAPVGEKSPRLSSMPPPLPDAAPVKPAKKEAEPARDEAPSVEAAEEEAAGVEEPAGDEEAAGDEAAPAPESEEAAAPSSSSSSSRALARFEKLRTMKMSNRSGAVMIAAILLIALAPLGYKLFKRYRIEKAAAAAKLAAPKKKTHLVDTPSPAPTNGPAWDEWPATPGGDAPAPSARPAGDKPSEKPGDNPGE